MRYEEFSPEKLYNRAKTWTNIPPMIKKIREQIGPDRAKDYKLIRLGTKAIYIQDISNPTCEMYITRRDSETYELYMVVTFEGYIVDRWILKDNDHQMEDIDYILTSTKNIYNLNKEL
jgi:hypothetical protein